jgi:hypothetical protein
LIRTVPRIDASVNLQKVTWLASAGDVGHGQDDLPPARKPLAASAKNLSAR